MWALVFHTTNAILTRKPFFSLLWQTFPQHMELWEHWNSVKPETTDDETDKGAIGANECHNAASKPTQTPPPN